MPVILRCSICNKVVGFCETPCIFYGEVPKSDYTEIYGDIKFNNEHKYIIQCIECLI